MRIGEQVRKFREQKKLSLTELAHASGIQIATLSRIENNKMTGTLESHLAIAKAMGIELTDLYLNLQQEEPVPSQVEEAAAEPLPSLTANARWKYLPGRSRPKRCSLRSSR